MESKKIVDTENRKKAIIDYFKWNKAFTLIEILVVIAILSLLFSTITVIFKSLYEGSLKLSSSSQELSKKIQIFWTLTRALYGSKKVILKNGTQLYLITTGGQFYGGVVKAVYIFKNGSLYYYEYPYPYGSLYDYNNKKLIQLAKFKNFKIYALVNKQLKETFYRKAKLYQLHIDNETFYIKTF